MLQARRAMPVMAAPLGHRASVEIGSVSEIPHVELVPKIIEEIEGKRKARGLG